MNVLVYCVTNCRRKFWFMIMVIIVTLQSLNMGKNMEEWHANCHLHRAKFQLTRCIKLFSKWKSFLLWTIFIIKRQNLLPPSWGWSGHSLGLTSTRDIERSFCPLFSLCALCPLLFCSAMSNDKMWKPTSDGWWVGGRSRSPELWLLGSSWPY